MRHTNRIRTGTGPAFLPSRLRLFIGTGVLLGSTLAASARVDAQPYPPRRGSELPPSAIELMNRDPTAFTFKRAYIHKVAQLRENRRLLEQGRLDTRGKTAEEVQALTTVMGTVHVPVFLGKFSDTGAGPIARVDLQKELFNGPWPTGTMTQYYAEISYGLLNVQGTVYDWATVSHDDDYYVASDRCGMDQGIDATDEFITEILAANDGAVNFGLYDNDGGDGMPNSGDDDGYVDFVAIAHPEAGGECNSGTCASAHNLWSHRSSLSAWPAGPFTTDDVSLEGGFIKVDDYTIMPALSCSGGIIEIGVFCHEFGHAFGLPDFYDTKRDGSTCLADFSTGVGEWDLMASGSWGFGGFEPERPTHMSAWCKAFVGWIAPGVVAFDLPNWSLPSSSSTPTALKLWTGGAPTTEYFLAEYRRAFGFDSSIFTPGLLIWHVDEENLDAHLLSNTPNANECHKVLDLECEDQSGADHTLNADDLDAATLYSQNRGDAGDPFCAGDAFTPSTNPSSDSYGATNTGVIVNNIQGCGNTSLRASFFVGVDPQDVDLCVRDCGSDVCTEPSSCTKWWASPDIYIDNNEDGIVDPPAEGIENKLFSSVRNVGTQNATDISVKFYFANPTLGLLFPSTADPIETDNVSIIGPAETQTAGVVWEIPIPPADIPHYCVGVIATNADDGQNAEWAPDDDNVGQINIQELYAKAGDDIPPMTGESTTDMARGAFGEPETFQTITRVTVCNPFRVSCNFQIRIGSPPNFDDAVIPAGWMVQLEYTQITLARGECAPLRVSVEKQNAVHTDQAVVPLTLMCGNVAAGGTILVYEIDNVEPKACAGFTATLQTPPDGDHFPGHGSVHLAWNDDFFDALGFPERVERWRIYNGNSPDFVPGPNNLVKVTCIDEDPDTVPYDHFGPVPAVAENTWYKIIAVDRAGNQAVSCATQVEVQVGIGEEPAGSPTATLVLDGPGLFRPGSEIRFSLPASGPVELTLYTITGRRIHRLVDEPQEAGEHRVLWDGRDSAGREVARGVYVCRLTQGHRQASQRLILWR